MDKYLKYLPILFFIYFIAISMFMQTSISISIGLIASALLFGYYYHITFVKYPSFLKELQSIREELTIAKSIVQQQKIEEIEALKQEVSKLSITLAKTPQTQQIERVKQKVLF